MDLTRRNFLSRFAAVIGTPTLFGSKGRDRSGPASCYDTRAYELPTPTRPQKPSHEGVVSEAYGKLVLSPERRYWMWPVCSNDEPVTIEYEVRAEGDALTPSVVVVHEDDIGEYLIRANSHQIIEDPLFSSTTIDLPYVGSHELTTGINLEHIHPENVPKEARGASRWDEGGSLTKQYTASCLNATSDESVHERHTIDAGDYFVIFDWTDAILNGPNQNHVTAHVSLRASHSLDDRIEKTATASMQQLYSRVGTQSPPLVETAVSLGEAICSALLKPSSVEMSPAPRQGAFKQKRYSVLFPAVVGSQFPRSSTVSN